MHILKNCTQHLLAIDLKILVSIVVVHLLGHIPLFLTPWTGSHQAPLSSTISQSLLRFTSIESVMPSSHLILCRPLLLPPSICPIIRVFSNESALHIRWPKYWSFSFSIGPSNEFSGLISFGIDWFDQSLGPYSFLNAGRNIFRSWKNPHSRLCPGSPPVLRDACTTEYGSGGRRGEFWSRAVSLKIRASQVWSEDLWLRIRWGFSLKMRCPSPSLWL